MTRLILMIGLPGSGKSYLAAQLKESYPEYCLISSDQIRAELFGSDTEQGEWSKVWHEIQSQMRAAVNQSPTTIYDATNFKRAYRQEVIALAREVGYQNILGLWLDTPLEICLTRNQERNRQVGPQIIIKMSEHLRDTPPNSVEGFDELMTVG